MNKAAIIMALADGPPIEFTTTANSGVGVTTIVKPSGVEVGDLVLVWTQNIPASATLVTTTGATWGRSVVSQVVAGPNNNSSLFWKVMTATDVAQAWVLSSAPTSFSVAVRYIGHGANTVITRTVGDYNGVGNTTLNLAGFTKSAGTYGVISVLVEQQTSGTPSVVPTGFTERARLALSGYTAVVADKLYDYVDGASVVWTLNTPPSNAESGLLLEVTGL